MAAGEGGGGGLSAKGAAKGGLVDLRFEKDTGAVVPSVPTIPIFCGTCTCAKEVACPWARLCLEASGWGKVATDDPSVDLASFGATPCC